MPSLRPRKTIDACEIPEISDLVLDGELSESDDQNSFGSWTINRTRTNPEAIKVLPHLCQVDRGRKMSIALNSEL